MCWTRRHNLLYWPMLNFTSRTSSQILSSSYANKGIEPKPEKGKYPSGKYWDKERSNRHSRDRQLIAKDPQERSTKIGWSMSDGVSLGRGKLRLRLALKDGSERLILNLYNVYYLPNSSCNLLSLGLLNDSGIYHNNKNETQYVV